MATASWAGLRSVSFCVAVEIRRTRWHLAVLAVVVACVAGSVMAALAGARRTESAVNRFGAAIDVGHAFITTEEAPAAGDELLAPLLRSDLVAASYEVHILTVAVEGGSPYDVLAFALGDDATELLEDPILLDGHKPDPDRTDTVVIDETMAQRRGLRVGERFRVHAFAPGQFGGEGRPRGPQLELTVAAIVRGPNDLVAEEAEGVEQRVFQPPQEMRLTPAFTREYGDRIGGFGGFIVDLRDGDAGVEPLRALARSIGGPSIQVDDEFDEVERGSLADARRATEVEANALFVFATLMGAGGLFVVGQVLGRHAFLRSANGPVLQALGMTDGQLAAVAIGRTALVGLLGGVVAVLGAVLCSVFTPVGVARRAEVDRGIDLDLPVLLAGFAVTVVAVPAWSAIATWRANRARRRTDGRLTAARLPAVASAVRRLPVPPTGVIGTRMALESGRGRTGLPVRSALLVTTLAVGALAAAVTFRADLSHLAGTPRLQGWNWDLAYITDPSTAGEEATSLAQDVAGVAGGSGMLYGSQDAIGILGVRPVGAGAFPRILDGRRPTTAAEVALGAGTMRTLDAEIGDEVALARRDLLVVGQALLPGGLGFPSMTMDDGATVTAEGFERLGLEPEAGIVAVRFVPGPDGNKARAVAVERGGVDVADAPRPFDVDNLWRVRSVPWLLAALLATLTAIVIGHTILSVVRSRRIDFAVVKVFGFTRGQVVAVVAWQATTIVMLASIVGMPLGVAGGGWAWSLVADALGTTPERVVPYAALTILAVVGLVTANVVGAWPGGMAARRRPASALHAE